MRDNRLPHENASSMVLFDIDGTLINTDGAGRLAMVMAGRELWDIPDAFEGYDFPGKTDPLILRDTCLRWFGEPPTAEMSKTFMDSYLKHLKKMIGAGRVAVKILPGVLALLNTLRNSAIPVGLATGNIEEGARLKLELAGLWHRFPFGGFGSDAEHRGALTAAGARKGCGHIGKEIDARRIFVVGDSPRDIEAAHWAGFQAVAVLTGWHDREEMSRHDPELCLDSLLDGDRLMEALTGDAHGSFD